MTMPEPTDLPDYVRPDIVAVRPIRERSRIMAEGTDAVHKAGPVILPQWPSELPQMYQHRATLTEVADFYGRTIEAAVGLLFGASIQHESDFPEPLAMLEEDADGHGTSLDDLARTVADDALVDGWAGLLADFPRVAAPGTLSVRDVQEQALRPYLVPIRASQVVSWRTSRRGAESFLIQLVLSEAAEVPDGVYGIITEDRYRVFTHDLGTNVVMVAVYAIDTSAIGQKTVRVVEPPAQIVGPDRIPLAQFGMFTAHPILNRLCWLNVGHYRVSADNRYLQALCDAPTLVIEKADPNDTAPVQIGPNSVWRLTGDQVAKWLQAQPGSLDSGAATMERLQTQMAALGMAFLARDKSARNETATGRQMDATADRATLGSVAEALSAMLTQAVTFAAAYVNNVAVPELEIAPDYDATRLDAQTITALSALATAGQISLGTLLMILQNGDVLPDGIDLEEEAESAKSDKAFADMTAAALAEAQQPVAVAA